MKKNDLGLRPDVVKTPREELEMLAELADTPHFAILKRAVRRYIENLKNLSYMLREEDPEFAIKHTRYAEQGVGMGIMIKFVEGAKDELAKMEE